MQKKCDRCQREFECKVDDISLCSCNKIELFDEIKSYLKETNYDCLCENCFQEVNNYKILKDKFPFPNSSKEFVKGIHYYIEGPYWVFTNYYHFLKGKCCKNNCRHCAYGYNITK